MSITLKELLGDNELEDIPQEHQENLAKSYLLFLKFRDRFGSPMVITSGYRSREKQIAIYAKKGITDLSKIPFGSKHMSGEAFDVADPHGLVRAFINDNPDFMDELNVFFEDFDSTSKPTPWVHIQIKPFKSYKKGGTRFFKP